MDNLDKLLIVVDTLQKLRGEQGWYSNDAWVGRMTKEYETKLRAIFDDPSLLSLTNCYCFAMGDPIALLSRVGMPDSVLPAIRKEKDVKNGLIKVWYSATDYHFAMFSKDEKGYYEKPDRDHQSRYIQKEEADKLYAAKFPHSKIIGRITVPLRTGWDEVDREVNGRDNYDLARIILEAYRGRFGDKIKNKDIDKFTKEVLPDIYKSDKKIRLLTTSEKNLMIKAFKQDCDALDNVIKNDYDDTNEKFETFVEHFLNHTWGDWFYDIDDFDNEKFEASHRTWEEDKDLQSKMREIYRKHLKKK